MPYEVIVEIDESLAMDPNEIEAKITPRTKAIVPSHLQGGVADLDPILEIARKHKLRVVEDCAQCCGGRYKGRCVGSIGDMGINSFQLSKTITSGEGGAVVSNDPKLFERAMRFHDVGALRSPYTEELKGGLLAAFAAVGLASADELGLDESKINVNGGAIALGHPVGMSGTRLAMTALYELRRRGGGVAAVALCGGGGQGDGAILRTL